MRTLITIVLCLAVCFASDSTFIDMDDIPYLSMFNYAQAVQENENVVIYFVNSPYHSYDLKEEFLDFVNKTTQTGATDIKFYKIDYGSIYLIMGLENLKKPPKLLFFLRKGEIVIPHPERRDESTLDWLNRIYGSGSKEVKTVDDVEELFKKNNAIALFFGETNSESFYNFTRITHSFEDALEAPVFVHTNEQVIMDKFNIAATETLAIIKKGEETKFHTEPFDITSLISFIDTYGLPEVLYFKEQMYFDFNEHESNVLFLFIVDNEAGVKAEETLRAISSRIRDTLTLVVFNKNVNKDFYDIEQIWNELDVPRDDIPAIRIMQYGDLQGKYALEKDITTENLIEFVNDYKNNKLKIWFKSDPIPTEPYNNGVRVVVGQNFEEVVMDENSDVLITMINFKYSEYYRNPASLSPRLQGIPGLVIARMELTNNVVNGLPKDPFMIYLYPKGKKDNPVRFKGDERSEKDLIEFLRKRSNVRSAEHGLTGLDFADKLVWCATHMMPFLNVILPFLD